MLLDWLGARHDDPRLADAAERVDGRSPPRWPAAPATRDLGGTASVSEFTAAVVDAIRSA